MAAWIYDELIAILAAKANGSYWAEPSIAEDNVRALNHSDPSAWD